MIAFDLYIYFNKMQLILTPNFIKMIEATPIILENYIDWVIMRKSVFLSVCEKNSVEGRTPKECIDHHFKDWTLLAVFWNFVIVDRKFYDVSKLVWEYF